MTTAETTIVGVVVGAAGAIAAAVVGAADSVQVTQDFNIPTIVGTVALTIVTLVAVAIPGYYRVKAGIEKGWQDTATMLKEASAAKDEHISRLQQTLADSAERERSAAKERAELVARIGRLEETRSIEPVLSAIHDLHVDDADRHKAILDDLVMIVEAQQRIAEAMERIAPAPRDPHTHPAQRAEDNISPA